MNRRVLQRTVWIWMLPALLLVVDLVVRVRVFREFSLGEWGYYVSSYVLVLVLYGWLMGATGGLARIKPFWLLRLAMVVVALPVVVLSAAGYGVYLSNGNLPDLFLFSFIRYQTENAVSLFKDSFRWFYVPGLLVLVAGCVVLLEMARREWVKRFVPNRLQSLGLGVVGVVAGVLCWTGTADRGQCFVPVVRIPAVLALYGYHEWKGLNTRPIELPPRHPRAVPVGMPQTEFNVLVILNESLRRQNLGIYGYGRDTTPGIAAFSSRHSGNVFQFDRAYTNSTATLLSVPSILTGVSPLQPLSVRQEAPMFWQWMKAAGMDGFYFTSHDFSWCRMGRFLTTPPPDAVWDLTMDGLPFFRDLGCDDQHTVDRAVREIRSRVSSGRPFAGVVHLNCNHYPYNTHEEFRRWKGTSEDDYDNTILEVDKHTTRLIDTLAAQGMLDRTIVVFASDHGEAFSEHGYIAHFYCHFAETISVPLWMYLPPDLVRKVDPEVLRENRSQPVQNLDILPTLLDCVGAWDFSAAEELHRSMGGHSLLRPLPRERAILITNADEVLNSRIGLSSVTGRHHYLMRTGSKPVREDLYDLEADPWERNNLWDSLTENERDVYRRRFLGYPGAARTIMDACPHLQGSGGGR